MANLSSTIRYGLLILIAFSAFELPLLQAKEITVEILKKQFIPAEITVEKGDTVIWINKEKRQYHNVWFKQLNKEEPQYIFPAETYTKTFNQVGNYPYECGPHPIMKGNVLVK